MILGSYFILFLEQGNWQHQVNFWFLGLQIIWHPWQVFDPGTLTFETRKSMSTWWSLRSNIPISFLLNSTFGMWIICLSGDQGRSFLIHVPVKQWRIIQMFSIWDRDEKAVHIGRVIYVSTANQFIPQAPEVVYIHWIKWTAKLMQCRKGEKP